MFFFLYYFLDIFRLLIFERFFLISCNFFFVFVLKFLKVTKVTTEHQNGLKWTKTAKYAFFGPKKPRLWPKPSEGARSRPA